jgi:hypothetical protein
MPDSPRPFVVDPRLGDVAPKVLGNRSDQPVSITSPLLEWSVISLAAISSPVGRALYSWESDIISDIYQGGVDSARVRIAEVRILNAPTTLGNQIRVPPGWSFDKWNRPVLVHEMAHVWQYQTQGSGYITDSVYHNASGQIATGDRNVAYMNYQLRPESNLKDFTAEEQATIIGDYYELTRIYQSDTCPPSWVGLRKPDLPIYERLIAQVRSSTPRAETIIYQDSLMSQRKPGFDLDAGLAAQPPAVMPLLQIRFRGL